MGCDSRSGSHAIDSAPSLNSLRNWRSGRITGQRDVILVLVDFLCYIRVADKPLPMRTTQGNSIQWRVLSSRSKHDAKFTLAYRLHAYSPRRKPFSRSK